MAIMRKLLILANAPIRDQRKWAPLTLDEHGHYRRLLGQSPAEADMQRFFQVTSPSVHQVVLALEKAGLITRQPGIARSITLTIDPADLPELVSRYDQPVKIAVQSYWLARNERQNLLQRLRPFQRLDIHRNDRVGS